MKKLPGQSLAVVECGIQICHSGHASPMLTYRHYSAHFILEGKGTYILDGKSYELGSGQRIMITPGALCIYIADKEAPWKYVYASFCRVDDDTLMHTEIQIFMGAPKEETSPLYNRPPRVTLGSLSAVVFNMDNQSKKQIRTVPS